MPLLPYIVTRNFKIRENIIMKHRSYFALVKTNQIVSSGELSFPAEVRTFFVRVNGPENMK